MKEKDENFYNEIFAKAPQYSLECDAEHSWHKDLYDFVITLFDKLDEILELGCGTGQFAKKIIDLGFNYYAGIDFSLTGIDMCRERCKGSNFICADLRMVNLIDFEYNTILSLETMEHIESDLKILEGIKENSKVIISLPCFDAESHIRFFNNDSEVFNRYHKIFSQIKVHTVNRYFVIEAIK